MGIPLSPDLSDDIWRSRVVDVVRRHWVQPHAAEPLPLTPHPSPQRGAGSKSSPFSPRGEGSKSSPLSPLGRGVGGEGRCARNRSTADQVEQRARTALDTMLTRQFRVGPLPPAELYEQFLQPIRRFVRKGKPIRVTVGFGPLKNPNAVRHSRADWAEFFALAHLVAWHNKVQRVYPPGLQFQIYFDDETLLLANGSNRSLMGSYMSSMAELIRLMGYQSVFLPPTCITRFAWFLRFGPYQLFRFTLIRIAEVRVRRWERDPANRDRMEQMKEYARRNVVVPAHLDPAAQERFVEQASHRFRVCWDALRLGAQLFPDRGRLLALYLDGSQHHRQQVALHLTSVDKGQMTQPWQGEGVLLDNGRHKLEPFVLTGGRRARYQARIIDGLNLIPAPGFDRLAVVWPQTVAEGSPLETAEPAAPRS